MAMPQAYMEQWPARPTARDILGPTAAGGAAARNKVRQQMRALLPFVLAHSQAARRDWRKLCALRRRLEEGTLRQTPRARKNVWVTPVPLAVVLKRTSLLKHSRDCQPTGECNLEMSADAGLPADFPEPSTGYIVAIPSYKRPDRFYEKTYKRVLEPLGLADKTLVFLQTDEDESAYDKKFAGTDVRFTRAPKGFAEVNYFIEHYFSRGAKVVVMHDDLKAILKLTTSNGKRKFRPLTAPAEAIEMFDLAFRTMEANGLSLGGAPQTKNPLNAPDEEIGLD